MGFEENSSPISGVSVKDVAIIGAGPCGLAVAARLCEPTPSALFTDDEHARYHWLNKHGKRTSLKDRKTGKIRPADAPNCDMSMPSQVKHPYSLLVLDSSSEKWMANWDRLFKMLNINHLRSPMFFHIDPADRDSLLAHTHAHKREGELQEICNCVGKEVSKNKRKRVVKRTGRIHTTKTAIEVDERDRKDYYTPSSSLFSNHCGDVVHRYGLGCGIIHKDTVVDIDFGPLKDDPALGNIFTLKTLSGKTHYSRTAVLAVGAGSAPRIPREMDPRAAHLCLASAIGHVPAAQLQGACHSLSISQFPDPSVMIKMQAGKAVCILVVGGGLTSAQLSHLAVSRGVTRVFHVMRSGFKVKPFDVDLAWMAKFRNREKAAFWSSDSDKDRLAAIDAARGGGSLNPPFARLLKDHIRKGHVRLLQHTTVKPVRFDGPTSTWRVRTEPYDQELAATEIDYIYFATGVAADFEKVACLKTLRRRFPLHGHGGLPCLAEDLEWWGKDASRNSVMKKGEREDWNETNYRASRESIEGLNATVSGTAENSPVERSVGSSDPTTKNGSTTIESTISNLESTSSHESTDAAKSPPYRIPLFVTGRLAGLRLGPGAGNLEGARLGAERIALGIEEYFAENNEFCRAHTAYGPPSARPKPHGNGVVSEGGKAKKQFEVGDRDEQVYRYAAGIGSRFESLALGRRESSAGDAAVGTGGSESEMELEFDDLFTG